MVNFSKLASRNDVRAAGALAAFAGFWLLKKGLQGRRVKRRHVKPRPEDLIEYRITDKDGVNRGPKAHVDRKFFKQIRYLLGIMIPGFWTKENGFLVLIAMSLLSRTACDVWMIQNATLIESSIVDRNRKLFLKRLITFFAAMPVVSIVNNMLKWSVGELRLRLRTNLTQYLYNQYLKGFTYYKMSNLDNRIANADQLLTTDVDKFCETLTELYTNVAKPFMDISLYVYTLTVNLGAKTPGMMLLYLAFSGVLLTNLRKPTGRMTVQEQKLEGEFRYINSRLITNSEEIAFYQGNNREKLTLMASFNKLTKHLRHFLEFRVLMGVVDNIVAKYVASVVGFYAVSIPFFDVNHHILGGPTINTQLRFTEYYTNGRMLVKLAEAIGRLVLAGRELTRLAGLTSRVSQLTEVLADLNDGKYNRTMINDNGSLDGGELQMPLIPGAGKIIYQDKIIHFKKVPLVTPNGDVLIKELTFEVRSGMNVIVCGPNGCGKSSLFRILGELWPIFGGELVKPPRGKLFYVPQRPYMTLGSLRDQVIYPHSREEMLRRGGTDAKLHKLVDLVKLSYLLQRERGWDAVEDWMDVLSGGEKQRIAMARLFYHAPQFAILDECTSAVSVDVEGSMYNYCKEAGISLFTVSHRKSLWVHHDFYLQMDGRGNYTFAPINGETEEFGS